MRNNLLEIPYSGGTYGTPVTLGSGFSYPTGVAVDATGNLFVAETNNNAVEEIPYGQSGYCTPVALGSGIYRPAAVAVDPHGRVYAVDLGDIWVFEP